MDATATLPTGYRFLSGCVYGGSLAGRSDGAKSSAGLKRGRQARRRRMQSAVDGASTVICPARRASRDVHGDLPDGGTGVIAIAEIDAAQPVQRLRVQAHGLVRVLDRSTSFWTASMSRASETRTIASTRSRGFPAPSCRRWPAPWSHPSQKVAPTATGVTHAARTIHSGRRMGVIIRRQGY